MLCLVGVLALVPIVCVTCLRENKLTKSSVMVTARMRLPSTAHPRDPPRLSLNHLRAYTSSPWRDEWRRHPMVGNPLRHTTPGLDIAIVGFGIYLIVEAAYNRLKRPSGNHHH
uniref:NADH dehydrogenase [ubiquinone] 1 beta subcomplex subunit 3-A n=3 Tax=Zea mays TaxID=4577 RepID=A0A804P2B9_MAIZE